jgi:methyl-accepting chemotaxis protein
VASEVKALSKRTAEATKEIRLKIEAVPQGARQTREFMDGIGNLIEQIYDISSTIAGAAEIQKFAIELSKIADQLREVLTAAG